MERHNLDKKWQLAVGRFLLTFGKLEWFTYHLLVVLPTERIFDSVKSLSFSQRINLIKDILNSKEINKDLQTKILEVLAGAASLLEFRNTVAHNPLYMGYYDSERGLDFRQQISKFTKLDSAITLEALEKKCGQVEQLTITAYSCESEIRRLKLDENNGA
jgi:hypothetical protein